MVDCYYGASLVGIVVCYRRKRTPPNELHPMPQESVGGLKEGEAKCIVEVNALSSLVLLAWKHNSHPPVKNLLQVQLQLPLK